VHGRNLTPLVPRIALQLVFIALLAWSGIHAATPREPVQKPNQLD
jgi:hypothetical protein